MRIELTGNLIIGKNDVRGLGRLAYAVDPLTGARQQPGYGEAGAVEMRLACALAQRSSDAFQAAGRQSRAGLLSLIADHIKLLSPVLAPRFMLESGLAEACANAEIAALIGNYQHAAHRVRALPDMRWATAPGPHLVLACSRYSLAASVGGDDTIDALASGCPVIAVADPAFPGTSELLARAIQSALAEAGLPDGVFSELLGAGELGASALLKSGAIAACTWAGSGNLFSAEHHPGAGVDVPAGEARPVFRDGDANPVFVLPYCLNARAEQIAQSFAAQATDAGGRGTAHAGVLIAAGTDGFVDLREILMEATEASGAMPLTPAAHARHATGVANLRAHGAIELGSEESASAGARAARHCLFEIDAARLIAQPRLLHCLSGPVTLLVRCVAADDLIALAIAVGRQSVVAIFADSADCALADAIRARCAGSRTRNLLNQLAAGGALAP